MAAGDETRVEGTAGSAAGARWAAVKELERRQPGFDPDSVEFETLEEGPDGARVVAFLASPAGRREEQSGGGRQAGDDAPDEQAENGSQREVEPEPEADDFDSEENSERDVERETRASDSEEAPAAKDVEEELGAEILGEEWPEDPVERAEMLVEGVLSVLDLEGDVSVEEDDEQLVVKISGPDLGLVIGKRGHTIDALQLICGQAAYRGCGDRKRVVVDAEGYRERREEMLCRQADQAASEALRNGRAVELDAMSAQERRVVHTYLKEQVEVETYSEGDEPYRYVVVAPVAGKGLYD